MCEYNRCVPPSFEKIRVEMRGLLFGCPTFFFAFAPFSRRFPAKRFWRAAAGREAAQGARLSAAIESSYLKSSCFFRGGFRRLLLGERSDGVAARRWITFWEKKGTRLGFLIASNPSIRLHVLPYCCSCVKTSLTKANFGGFQYLSLTSVVGFNREED